MADPYDNPYERHSYKSELTEQLRASGGRITFGRVTVCSAPSFGFCWGVDRAVAMVQDALADYPGRRIWLLDQIIHNPRVNADFKAQGVHFVRGPFADPDANGEPGPEDVAVIPAFSATVEDMEWLKDRGCTIVDTTCPWVIKPHRRTIKYVQDGFTTMIHGLVNHEETRASCSLIASRGGHYIVVADKKQADSVGDVIRGRADATVVLSALAPGSVSEGFDIEQHMQRVGTINQTTMLAAETREIERIVRDAMKERFGEENLAEHFRELNTICGATQDNQDAVTELSADGDLDLLIVVGGYDSSNTRNLTRVGSGDFPSYHVDGPNALHEESIRHRDPEVGEFRETRDWLPEGPVIVGFTAGASTPDTLLGETITRLLELAGEPLDVTATT